MHPSDTASAPHDGRFTLLQPHSHRQDIRKSRFLAQAARVDSIEAAQAFLSEAADATATHNCWAWRVGSLYRFHDDGEPSGTAGRPILQAIDAQQIDQVAVVVTRWYGGIKLGTGGLARAYGGTAAECLRLAARTPLVALARLCVRCAFADLALLKSRLPDLHAELESEQFDAGGVTLGLRLPVALFTAVVVLVADITRGRGEVSRID